LPRSNDCRARNRTRSGVLRQGALGRRHRCGSGAASGPVSA
jgi:hypothetical protein